ncbi:zinc finger domain-containing protein [Streptomyces sp. MMS24-I29]|uniref:zinc finger domain-containing protein n=1 Tax=Streptomyces sp. MMS24-I29 TaxID=3351480 RepID=UPI003C7CC627
MNVAIGVACPYCGAVTGKPCVSRYGTGQPIKGFHGARKAAATQVRRSKEDGTA